MKERGRVPMAQWFENEEAEESVLDFLKETDIGRETGT
jgi:hypothetical protein